ncbi:MAG: hypothetical protein ACOH12_09960 [Parvibaculaceae bacterium]
MLSPANSSYSEDYWRDRCGMPPRDDIYAADHAYHRNHQSGSRRQPVARSFIAAPFAFFAFVVMRMAALFRSSKSRPVQSMSFQSSPARAMQANLQASLQANGLRSKKSSRLRLPRRTIIKLSLGIVGAVWAGGLALVYLHPAPQGMDFSAAYVGLGKEAPAMLVAADAKTATKPADLKFEAMLVSFADANEAALVALRGYLITGSEGFHSEWQEATSRLEAAQMAIEVDSRNWSDGGRIMQLRDMRKTIAAMKAEEDVLAGLAATPNRYPGLRLYRDTTARALAEAEGLLDVTLASVMQSNRPGAAGRIDTLAHIRADLRNLRLSLDAYLPSSAKAAPADLMAQYASFRADLLALSAMRNQVGSDDQGRVDRLNYLLNQSDTELQHIVALKPTPRWDYADFAFKQKVLPLSEKISSTLAGWRD